MFTQLYGKTKKQTIVTKFFYAIFSGVSGVPGENVLAFHFNDVNALAQKQKIC